MSGFTKQQILGMGFTSQRRRDDLVKRLSQQGIKDQRVLNVMSKMPRHLFLDEAMANRAYEDTALPIGHGQTISQPFVVARMTEQVVCEDPLPTHVLEVGTGSGYQTAILAMLVAKVYTVERIVELHSQARCLFEQMKFKNIMSCHSDGSWGWEQYAPYDVIIVTAAPDQIPEQLLLQLKIGGKLIIPVGGRNALQRLTMVYRISAHQFETDELEWVKFVPFLEGAV